MKKVRGAFLGVPKFIDRVFDIYDEHRTPILWAIFTLLPAGIGLLALSVRLNSTSGWFFYPAIMILAGGVVGLSYMAKTHEMQLQRASDRRYERNKRRSHGSW